SLSRMTPHPRSWRRSEPFEEAVAAIARIMEESRAVPVHAVRAGALLWLMDYLSGEPTGRSPAERFLGRLTDSDAEALRSIANTLFKQVPDPATVAIEARYEWISRVVRQVTRQLGTLPGENRPSTHPADRVDRILTHRVFGLLIFAGVMFTLFLGIFSGAEPLMDLIETGQRALADEVGSWLSEGPLRSLLTDGLIAGVGAVIIFFPQICILFLFLSILEDSGYMARAAFLMDRLMSRVGLHGRSFIPLLSSYACAIPGILATRTIENRRDRFATILIAPLMSCSARLPIYIIVIGAVFGDQLWLKALVMFSMYLLGTVTALLMALFLKKTLFAGPKPAFIMELPPYHMPQLGVILRTMWDRSKLFLTGAGTTIFAVSVVIWARSYFPRLEETALSPESREAIALVPQADLTARANIIAGDQLRRSYLGRLGRGLEPVIEPLGFDWRIGVGILSSFLAREVFVSTMGITFSLGEEDETSTALQEQFASAKWPDGRVVLTPLVGIGLMVFYVLACQCVSTLAVVRRETGSWRWPGLMFAYMTCMAYLGSLAVYQVGIRLGWG
ncbi:MAG: ferrous iron transport protein B, partial [Phycisphaerae bacterium]